MQDDFEAIADVSDLCERPSQSDDQAVKDVNRTTVYQWFGNLFGSELSAEMIETYRGDLGMEFLIFIGQNAGCKDGVDQFRQLISGPESAERVAMDLAGAFARLFLGAGGRQTAPPYQSVYQADCSRLFQGPVAEMEEIMRSLEIRPLAYFKEPADHIAVQLNVMAQLVERSTWQDQLSFLESHLMTWIPNFARACQAYDRSHFYGCIAEMLQHWLIADRTVLLSNYTNLDDKYEAAPLVPPTSNPNWRKERG